MRKKAATKGTPERIIQAASEVFALKGFESVTVREICSRAGVNVASINYHFGDKDGLYEAVTRHYQQLMLQRYPLPDVSLPPEERLRAFIAMFLHRTLDTGEHAFFGKLMAHEIVRPTRQLDRVVNEVFRHSFAFLSNTVGTIVGRQADDHVVRQCCSSIIGQCLHYHYAREVLARMPGWGGGFTPERIGQLADHITRFSLHALRAIATDAAS